MSLPTCLPRRNPRAATASAPSRRRLLDAPARWLPRTAVLGAGHGGLALAGYLAALGTTVHLWNRSPAPVQAVAMQGFIRLAMPDHPAPPAGLVVVRPPGGQPKAACHASERRATVRQAAIDQATCCMETALAGARLVLVALPATAHREVARLAAAFLTDGQTVLLLPGRTGGALEFRQALRESGCTADVTVAEAQTFPFASRVTAPAAATIHGIKQRVEIAALPACRTAATLALCQTLLPMLAPARSVLQTSLENMGAMLHPIITLLNAGRIEGPEAFRFYVDGVTPAVAVTLVRADTERQAVARAYGVAVRSLPEWLADAYGLGCQPSDNGRVSGNAAVLLRQIITTNPAYQAITAPIGLDHRYVWEDVPTGLVPLAELGRAAGVPCPTLDGLIATANAMHGTDYRAKGRILLRLGLEGLSPRQVRWMAETGDPDLSESPDDWGASAVDNRQPACTAVADGESGHPEPDEWRHALLVAATSDPAGNSFLAEVLS